MRRVVAALRYVPSRSFRAMRMVSSMSEESAAALGVLAQSYDAAQIRLMEESIIVTDADDVALGPGSKFDCHLNSNIEKGMLHRAFSVFMFDENHRLLMQQRSDAKITFPLNWANTCCSHPAHTVAELERGPGLNEHTGVKRAAQRRLKEEMGIPYEQVALERFDWLTCIHYVAMNGAGPGGSDSMWGEAELDHILFIRVDAAEVTLAVDENEINDARFFSRAELSDLVADGDALVSPWFRKIYATLLPAWWDEVEAGRSPAGAAAAAGQDAAVVRL
jgi:isopentenyl-diphosphate delta-isomerase